MSTETVYLRVPMTATSKTLKSFTREEVAKHNKEGDCWTIIDTAVYDLSKFADMHPGGGSLLYDATVAGKDSTETFFGLHRSEVLVKYGRLIIGTIEGAKPVYILPTPGVLSPVPYAEPGWLSEGFKSPYYKASHLALQRYMRKFTDEFVTPDAMEKESSGERPDVELIQKMGAANINVMRLGPTKLLHGLTLVDGLKGEDFDYFHELIITQELVRGGARGYGDGLQGGMVIGLPPVINFGSAALKKQVVPDVLAGRKFICLAISEAFAGSDVQGIRCTATKTADGKNYLVNGTKKWITNGTFADYFSVGVNTGNGLSMLLIPRGEGVSTKQIKTSYSTTAGTAYIEFDNVLVPVENLLGKEGKGIYVILSNFNHERWVMACASCRSSRFIVEETFKWACQRKVFGKGLIEQPVVRAQFASMFAKVEAMQSLLEHVTFQMCNMTYAEQSDLLAGPIGLLKMQATRVANDISTECVQIFGGRSITASGMGKHIEHFQRTQAFDSILGGSEAILGDLAVRQASRKMPRAVL